jgi:hypothetical protein
VPVDWGIAACGTLMTRYHPSRRRVMGALTLLPWQENWRVSLERRFGLQVEFGTVSVTSISQKPRD